MDAETFKHGFLGVKQDLKVARYTQLVLGICLLICLFFVVTKRERLVIIPPIMSERVELAYDSANAPYYKSYALYVASFLGNINPDNATFVREGLSLSFSAEMYNQVQRMIAENAEKMRTTGRSIRFYPDKVLFEEKTGRTFVAGKQEIVSASGAVSDQDVTYEMQIQIRDGLPKVYKYSQYSGSPHTEEWMQRNRHTTRDTNTGS